MPAKKTATKRKPQKLPYGGLGQDPALAKAVSAPLSTKRGLGRVLTAQQLKFVHELVAGEGKVTKKEAAIRAGIPEEKATYTAALYLQSGAVLKAIQDFRAELSEKYGTNFERHMRDLQIIRDAALEAGNYGAAVQAEYRRGQALGSIYIERKEIRHGTIDSMSKEEVMRKLQEIKSMYRTGGQPIEDIQENTLLIEEDNGHDTGSEVIQETEGEPNTSEPNETGIEGEPGDTGLFGGFTFDEDVDNVGAEGRKAWPLGKP